MYLRDVHSVSLWSDDNPRLRAEVGRVWREGLPAEGGVVLHEAPVALDVGRGDALGRGDRLAARVRERPVAVRAVDDVRGRRIFGPSLPIDFLYFISFLAHLGFQGRIKVISPLKCSSGLA